MPADSQCSDGGQRKETSEYPPRRADRSLDPVREESRKQANQSLAAGPVRVVGWESRADGDRNAIRNEEHETGAEHRCPPPRERAEPFKRGERPAHAEDGHDDCAYAEQLPQRVA